MSEKFPYGYDVNAYIDKAFEQMKADFPWATREMIAENTNLGIEKMDGEYQYVSYHSRYDGTLKLLRHAVSQLFNLSKYNEKNRNDDVCPCGNYILWE